MKEGRTSFARAGGCNTLASLVTGVFIAVSVLLLPTARASAANINVDTAAPGTNTGADWVNAYTSLQSALTAAVSGDTINVAKGTYKPTTGTDRTATFQLKNGVTVLGGYPTGGGTRNPSTNVTTLSGDIGTIGSNSDNSYHVLTGIGLSSSASLDGFTVTGGNANGSSPDDQGGGMYNDSSSPTLTNVTFTGNSANHGGGMSNYVYSSPTLTNVTFSGNSVYNYGGGMNNFFYCSPTLTNVTFSGNSTDSYGGGMLNKAHCSPTLTNVTFSGNSASIDGGGMYNDEYSSPTLTNVTFSGNSAARGGGMLNADSSPTLRNSILWGDTPDQIYNWTNYAPATPTVSDSVVQGGYASGTNIITADPKLGTLGDYGGYTQTVPLLAGSSAIDTANAAFAPATDQRGVARPQGAGNDIGAYEYDGTGPNPAPTVTGITPNSGLNTGSVNITNLAGTGFVSGATVKLTGGGPTNPDIGASSAIVVSSTQITCTFDLTGKAAGKWNVMVTNPDTQSGTLANGFTIGYPAPTVTSITPSSGLNNGSVNITDLAGTGIFLTGATVKLTKSGQSDIAGTNVTVASSTQITCSFDLTGKAVGAWNVVVTNTDTQSGTLANGFTIGYPAPTVTSITPNSGINNGSASITNLAGTGFLSGATAKLTKTGAMDINATGVAVVSATQITCTFDLTSAETGQWNVVVTNPDSQSGTLVNGFTINQGTTHDVALTSLSAAPNPATKGQTVTVTYTVKNNGTGTENNLTFKLSYGSTALGSQQTVGTLTAGQQTTKTMSVKVPRRQKSGDYLITGTVSTVSGETNTADNSATVKVTVK